MTRHFRHPEISFTALILAAGLLFGVPRAFALETVTLDNVKVGDDKNTAAFRHIEFVGTNLTKDEITKLFTSSTPKDEVAAIASKMVASRISIPDISITDKDFTVTLKDLQVTDVNQGKVGHVVLAGFAGAGDADGGKVTFKSGSFAVDGGDLSGLLSAMKSGDLGSTTSNFGHFSWQNLEVNAPDKDTPASAPGGNLFKIRLAEVSGDATYDGAIPLKTTGAIKGLTIEVPPASEAGKALASAGMDKLDLGFTYGSTYDPAGKSFALDDFTLSGTNLGSLGLKIHLGGLEKAMFSGQTEARMAALLGGNIDSLEIRFVNAGMFEKALVLAAAQQKTTPDALKQQADTMTAQLVPTMLGGGPDALKITDALRKFIANPKGLILSAKAKSGALAFTDVAGLIDPQAFFAKVDVTVLAQADGAAAPPAAAASAISAAAASPPTAQARTAAAAPPRLTGISAWAAIAGNTISGKDEDGDPYFEFFNANGTVKELDDDDISTGKWVLRGQQVCLKMQDEDDETCYKVTVDGTTATFTEEDGSGTRYEILQGNPKRL